MTRMLVPTLALLLLAFAGPARAVPLPASGAHAEASASAPGATPPPATDDGPAMASASATANGSDDAAADTNASVGGAVRGSSAVEGASGAQGPSEASTLARWTSGVLVGGSGGGPVDVDLRLDVDGVLDYFHNNANPGVDDVLAEVGARVVVHDMLGAQTVFDGSATLATDASGNGLLTRAGDWASAARDGDFSPGACGAFACDVTVAAAIDFDDSLFVAFGQTFAVEIELTTRAFMFNGFEVEALSDFLSTASLTIESDTAGATFELVSVPEPATLLLLLSALLAVRARR